MYSQYESVHADSMSFIFVVRRIRFLVRFLQPNTNLKSRKSTVIIVCSNFQFKGLHICYIHFIYIVMYASYDEVLSDYKVHEGSLYLFASYL